MKIEIQIKERTMFLFVIGFIFILMAMILTSVLILAEETPGFNQQVQSQPYIYENAQASPWMQVPWQDKYCNESEMGMDFIVEIPPDACTPAVVRSDLLEEQDVPVFCRMTGIKINPLIQIPYIKSIVPTVEDRSPEINYITFLPARYALSYYASKDQKPASFQGVPSMSNLGYLLIDLKSQPVEEKMPDNVRANISLKLRYDVGKTYGINEHQFILPLLGNDEWQKEYEKYNFWQGKGFLRLNEITGPNTAKVSVYTSVNSIPTTKEVRVGVVPGKGDEIMLPGFYCGVGVNLRLDEITVPKTRARLIVNGDELLIGEGEEIQDSDCYVVSIIPSLYSYGGDVKIRCGSKDPQFLSLEDLEANIEIRDGAEITSKKVGIGDDLELSKDVEGINHVYVGFIGKELAKDGLTDIMVLFQKENADALNEKSIEKISKVIHDYVEAKRQKALNVMSEGMWKTEIEKELIKKKHSELKKTKIYVVKKGAGYKDINGAKSEVKLVSVEGPMQAKYSNGVEAAYKEAIEQYKDIAYGYSETYNEEGTYYGIKAYDEAVKLAEYMHKTNDQVSLLQEMINKYSDSEEYEVIEEVEHAREILRRITAVGGDNVKQFKSQEGLFLIRLVSIEKPSTEMQSAEIEVDGVRKIYSIYTEVNDWEIINIDDASIILENKTGSKETIVKGSWKYLDKKKIYLIDTKIKREVKISVLPFEKERTTTVNFTVQIGIEKRAIKLSPEKTKDMIRNLDNLISKFEGINKNLGNVVSFWNKACYVGAGALWIKNFITGLGGKATARKMVMDKWSIKCSNKAYQNQIGAKSISDCYRKKETAINDDIEIMQNSLNGANDFIKDVKKQDGVMVSGGLLGLDKTPNEKKFMEVAQENFPQELRDIKIIGKDGQEIDSSEIIDNITSLNNQGYIFKDDVKDLHLRLDLYKNCQGNPDSVLCGSVLEGTYGQLDYFTESLENVETKSAYNSLFGHNPVVVREKDMQIIPAPLYVVNDAFISKFEQGSRNIMFDNKGFRYAEFNFESTYYIAILASQGDGIFSIEKLYEIDKEKLLNNKGIIKERYEKEELVPQLKLMKIADVQEIDITLCNNNMISRGLDDGEPWNTVKFWESGPYKGLVAYLPLRKNDGWYMATTSYTGMEGAMTAYKESGNINTFYICNVGQDGIPNFDFLSGQKGDDCCTLVSAVQGIQNLEIAPLNAAGSKAVHQEAIKCASEASRQFLQGSRKISTSCVRTLVHGKPPSSRATVECEDFMSPSDCWKMFNLCDPVMCPPSRCDFGGRMPVSNVVQSGVIGSLLLCWPNFEGGRGVLVPICLTGVHAGLESFTGVLKSGRDCLQEQLDTGRTIGICDQIMSVYMCEFFWRQFDPFIKAGLPAITESLMNRGGGEYALFSDSWKQSIEGVNYFTDFYGKNQIQAFKARSTAQIGSEICKKFVSVAYPTQAKFWDELSEPESPTQVTAWFDEIAVGGPSPEGHYKVFSYIWAGKDQGVYYSVYLTNPSTTGGYYQTPEYYPVPKASGYLKAGEYISISPDFRAPSGYKEICVNINGQPICGFGQATTDFALKELQNLYIESQATDDIKTAKECVSGKPTIIPTATLNIQSAVEHSLEPSIYKKGIIRICSKLNPGTGTGKSNWKNIGYCDNPDVGCWLDTNSVEGAVSDLGIKEEIMQEAEFKDMQHMIDKLGYDHPDESRAKIDKIRKKIPDVKESAERLMDEIDKIEKIEDLEKQKTTYNTKAKIIDKTISSLIGEFQDTLATCVNEEEKVKAEWHIAELFDLRTKLLSKLEVAILEKELEKQIKEEGRITCTSLGGQWKDKCSDFEDQITSDVGSKDRLEHPGKVCCKMIEAELPFQAWPSDTMKYIIDCKWSSGIMKRSPIEITIRSPMKPIIKRWNEEELYVRVIGRGVVLLAADNEKPGKKYVIVKHGDSLYTYYGNLKEIVVKNGKVVNENNVIGLATSTTVFPIKRAEFTFRVLTRPYLDLDHEEDPMCFFSKDLVKKIPYDYFNALCYSTKMEEYYDSQECVEARRKAIVQTGEYEEPIGPFPLPPYGEPIGPEPSEEPIIATKTLQEAVIVIDPGHGTYIKDGKTIYDPGTVWPLPPKEAEFTEEEIVLSISKKLKTLLENQGATIYMTREDSKTPKTKGSTLANDKNADLLLSIHVNGGGGDGTEIWIPCGGCESPEEIREGFYYCKVEDLCETNEREFLESKQVSEYILEKITSAIGTRKRDWSEEGIGYSLSYGILKVDVPAMIIETAFLSDERERAILTDAEGQQKIANAVSDSLAEYYGTAEIMEKKCSEITDQTNCEIKKEECWFDSDDSICKSCPQLVRPNAGCEGAREGFFDWGKRNILFNNQKDCEENNCGLDCKWLNNECVSSSVAAEQEIDPELEQYLNEFAIENLKTESGIYIWQEITPSDTLALMDAKVEFQEVESQLGQFAEQYEIQGNEYVLSWEEKLNYKIEEINEDLNSQMSDEWDDFVKEDAEKLITEKHKADCADFAIQLLADFAESLCTDLDRNYELNVYGSSGNLIIGDASKIRDSVGTRGLLDDRSTVRAIDLEFISIQNDLLGYPQRIKQDSYNPKNLEPGDILIYRWRDVGNNVGGWDSVVYVDKKYVGKYIPEQKEIWQHILGKGNLVNGQISAVEYRKTVNFDIKRDNWEDIIIDDDYLAEKGTVAASTFSRQYGKYNYYFLDEDLYDIRRWNFPEVVVCKA